MATATRQGEAAKTFFQSLSDDELHLIKDKLVDRWKAELGVEELSDPERKAAAEALSTVREKRKIEVRVGRPRVSAREIRSLEVQEAQGQDWVPQFSVSECKGKRYVAEGAFGKVHRVSRDKQHYALKEVTKIERGLRANATEIERELLTLKKAQAVEGVVRLYATEEQGATIRLVLEWAPQTLENFINTKKRVTVEHVEHYYNGLKRALTQVHKLGIIHRDLKPDNMLLRKTDTGDELILCDFGCARFSARKMSKDVGMLWYRAPELVMSKAVSGEMHYSRGTDLWSAGLVLFELELAVIAEPEDRLPLFVVMDQEPVSLFVLIEATLGPPGKPPRDYEAYKSLLRPQERRYLKLQKEEPKPDLTQFQAGSLLKWRTEE